MDGNIGKRDINPLFGLIGFPLGHSFSAGYFSDKFRKEHIDAMYRLFELKSLEELSSLLDSNRNLLGLNVTIPYKRQIFEYLDKISPEAKAIGAVNVLSVARDHGDSFKLTGYNSDWLGFKESIINLLDPGMERALVLGTGGASGAVAYALDSIGIKVTFVSRNKNKCRKPEGKPCITYSELNEDYIRNHLIIVNTTPLGMWPNVSQAPEIPYHALTSRHLCYDLVYNPEVTEFMKRAARHGAKIKNGLEMLHRQAEIAWSIWSRDFPQLFD